jgi:hypothetical protein
MRGYTAKVGLRKSQLRFDALRARRVVRQVPEPPWSLDEWGITVPVPPPNPLLAANCTHCTCTYTAECCYCDGGQVHR